MMIHFKIMMTHFKIMMTHFKIENKIIHNPKIKIVQIGKFIFSFVSAHWASLIKIWPLPRKGETVCILLIENKIRCAMFWNVCKTIFWLFSSNKVFILSLSFYKKNLFRCISEYSEKKNLKKNLRRKIGNCQHFFRNFCFLKRCKKKVSAKSE